MVYLTIVSKTILFLTVCFVWRPHGGLTENKFGFILVNARETRATIPPLLSSLLFFPSIRFQTSSERCGLTKSRCVLTPPDPDRVLDWISVVVVCTGISGPTFPSSFLSLAAYTRVHASVEEVLVFPGAGGRWPYQTINLEWQRLRETIIDNMSRQSVAVEAGASHFTTCLFHKFMVSYHLPFHSLFY